MHVFFGMTVVLFGFYYTLEMQLLGLQINAEKYYFGIRKSLVEFDEVLEVFAYLYSVALFCNFHTKFKL